MDDADEAEEEFYDQPSRGCLYRVAVIVCLVVFLIASSITFSFFLILLADILIGIGYNTVTVLFFVLSPIFAAMELGLIWKYRLALSSIVHRILNRIRNTRAVLYFFPQRSVNDPATLEDGWQPGNASRARKFAFWSFFTAMAIPIIAIIVWTVAYTYYAGQRRQLSSKLIQLGIPASPSDLNVVVPPNKLNVAREIEQAYVSLTSSIGSYYYVNQNSLDYIFLRIINDPSVELSKSSDNTSYERVPITIKSLSETGLVSLYINKLSNPAFDRFMTEASAALELDKICLSRTAGIAFSQDYWDDVSALNSVCDQSGEIVLHHSYAQALSGKKDQAIASLVGALRLYRKRKEANVFGESILFLDRFQQRNKVNNILFEIVKMHQYSPDVYRQLVAFYDLSACIDYREPIVSMAAYCSEIEAFYEDVIKNRANSWHCPETPYEKSLFFIDRLARYHNSCQELKFYIQALTLPQGVKSWEYLDTITKYTAEHKAKGRWSYYFSEFSKNIESLEFIQLALERTLLVISVASSDRIVRIGLALELYYSDCGQYPQSLNELVPKYLDGLPVDPLNGLPFLYEKSETEIVVQSVGRPDAEKTAPLTWRMPIR